MKIAIYRGPAGTTGVPRVRKKTENSAVGCYDGIIEIYSRVQRTVAVLKYFPFHNNKLIDNVNGVLSCGCCEIWENLIFVFENVCFI